MWDKLYICYLERHRKDASPEEVIEALEFVDAEAIQRLARQVLSERRLSLAIVAPGVTEASAWKLVACFDALGTP